VAVVETSELGDENARAWRVTVADTVDLLPRQAERLWMRTQGTFGTRSAAVFLLHTGQARVAELWDHLWRLREAQTAAEGA
jgi:hypothetical protein